MQMHLDHNISQTIVDMERILTFINHEEQKVTLTIKVKSQAHSAKSIKSQY